MKKSVESFIVQIANIFLYHQKMERVYSQELSIDADGFDEYINKALRFHQKSGKHLREILEDFPEIPVHRHFDETSTLGLPIQEYDLDLLQESSDQYVISALTQAEANFKKYFQETLNNDSLPKPFRKQMKDKLDELSLLLEQLNQFDKTSK